MQKENTRKIAEGRTAELYILSKSRVLKLFRPGYSQNTVLREYRNHQLVAGKPVRIPKVYECTEVQNRFGYVMENIPGQPLASQMADSRTFERAMSLFTSLHQNWLLNRSDLAVSYKQWMLNTVREAPGAAYLSEMINWLPDDSILCHGDFHPYNILMPSDGEPVIIDFANVCAGPADYDIARTWFLLKEATPGQTVAEIYLNRMNRTWQDIKKYVEVLKALRRYE